MCQPPGRSRNFSSAGAGDVYPRYDFARMTDDEYGAALALD
jgi:hypothetical protein